jgi:hypothetical protein
MLLGLFSAGSLLAGNNLLHEASGDSSLAIDTSKILRKEPKKEVFKPHAKISGLLSAVVPGAGQIYNRKYWKAPVIWAAAGAVGFLIYTNHQTYAQYRDALRLRTDNDPNTLDAFEQTLTENDLLTLQDAARRSRDLWIILTSLGHALNVVDAVVDAHLATFDVSDDLSMRLSPAIISSRQQIKPGLSITFNFR